MQAAGGAASGAAGGAPDPSAMAGGAASGGADPAAAAGGAGGAPPTARDLSALLYQRDLEDLWVRDAYEEGYSHGLQARDAYAYADPEAEVWGEEWY